MPECKRFWGRSLGLLVGGALSLAPAVARAQAGALELLAGGGAVKGPVELPLQMVSDTTSNARIADSAALVGVVVGLLAIGYLLRRATGAFNPWAFTGAVLGVAFLTVVNIEPFQIESTTLDEAGVTQTRYGGERAALRWQDIEEIQWDEGRLWPFFTHDAALQLRGGDGVEVSIPAWTGQGPMAAEIARSRLPSGVRVVE